MGDRAGLKRGFATARTFVGRRVGVAVAAVAMLALAPGATGDVPLINLSVYGTLGQNGWYVSSVTLDWSFSGPLYSSTGCSNMTLTADTPGTTFTCTATSLDRSTTMSLSKTIKLDQTPPTLSKLAARAGSRRLDLSWVASSDTQLVQVMRTSNASGGKSRLVYSGTRASFRDTRVKVGTRYRYTVTAIDQAGNRAAKTLAVSAPGTLFAPMPGERVSRAPVQVDAGQTRPVLQRPARARQEDPQRMAYDDPLPGAALVGLPWTPLPAAAWRLPVVRLARPRHPLREQIRRHARRQLVRVLARLAVSRGAGRPATEESPASLLTAAAACPKIASCTHDSGSASGIKPTRRSTCRPWLARTRSCLRDALSPARLALLQAGGRRFDPGTLHSPQPA